MTTITAAGPRTCRSPIAQDLADLIDHVHAGIQLAAGSRLAAVSGAQPGSVAGRMSTAVLDLLHVAYGCDAGAVWHTMTTSTASHAEAAAQVARRRGERHARQCAGATRSDDERLCPYCSVTVRDDDATEVCFRDGGVTMHTECHYHSGCICR